MKGAVERVLQRCAFLYMPDSEDGACLLDERGKSVVMSKAKEYALSGLRGTVHLFCTCTIIIRSSVNPVYDLCV